MFWDGFYEHAEKNFLPEAEKHYFIWTDDRNILKLSKKNPYIHTYQQKPEPWPYPTLKRFEYFLRAETDLEKMDYCMYMNSNLIVNEVIHEDEILPKGEEKLFFTLHPGYFEKPLEDYPYDRNPLCSAYVKETEGQYYFAGGFNGGVTSEYLNMMKCLSERIQKDLEKGIIPVWHDESQINKYAIEYDKPYRILNPCYLNPENKDWNILFEKKIIVLDKEKYGGHDFLRDNRTFIMKVIKYIRNILGK